MGFFQDLKEDLSMAVNELMPEETVEEAVKAETTEGAAETVAVDEDLFRAAVERLDESADVFAEDKVDEEEAELVAAVEAAMAEEIAQEENVAETVEEVTAAVVEEVAAEPVKETAPEVPIVAANELVKEVCEAVEQDKEETELEKEVEKVMTQQKETVLTGEVLDETAVITKGMKVSGDIVSQGSMEVLGSIKGNIEILGKLDISGEVEGNSTAAEVFADSAKITGEIHANGSVKVGQSSVIIGNIYATSAVIAGAVKGDIDVQGPVILDTSAIVMGNIKSKSVQINNGAVIEGMCSQCYAEVNPASFFQDLK